MDLVSIIVPVHNVEKYLKECVDSLIYQVYTNIEIILVDDGSTDSSSTICDKYSNDYEFISVIHKKNAGLGYARNSGLEIAKGKFVIFMDSDDYADPKLVDDLMNAMNKYNADICLGGFERVNDYNEVLYSEQYDEMSFNNHEVMEKLFMRMLGSSPKKSDAIRMSVWNVIYSMNIIKKNNIKFPSERELISEDIIFNSYYYPHVKCAVTISNTAYKYRYNHNSLTTIYKHNRLEKTNILYHAIEKRILELNLPDTAMDRLRRQTFIGYKTCMKQEIFNKQNKSVIKKIRNIKRICNNEDFFNMINSYPVNMLPIKQQVFLLLSKNKCATILYFLLKIVP